MPLKANVGLSRRLSRNDGSRGFSLHLEGEILATLDDPEAVIERIRQLYAVAEEAVDRQISESLEIDAIAGRDVDGSPGISPVGDTEGHTSTEPTPPPSSRGGDHGQGPGDLATKKQLQFIHALAKRRNLSGPQLRDFVEGVVGYPGPVSEISKKEAGKLIDRLSGDPSSNPCLEGPPGTGPRPHVFSEDGDGSSGERRPC